VLFSCLFIGGGGYVSNIEAAERDYVSGMKYKQIAEKYNVSINTVKSWKVRYKWARKNMHTKSKGVHTKQEKVCTQNQNVCNEAGVKEKLIGSVEANDELTEKRKLFCLYYADCLNATQAYFKAFGGKRVVASVEGCRLLINPKIKAEINRLKQIKYESLMLQADDIVERQMRIAFADMTDFASVSIKKTDKGHEYNQLLFKDSSEIDGTVIQEIKETQQGLSVKLKDSQKAFDWLTKYFEFNPQDKHKVAFDNAKLAIERKKDAMNDADQEKATVVKLVIDEP
jgi:phage terminase small subunit